MSAPHYTVRAYASWSDVDRGRIAHGSRHDGPGARERAMALREALPYPIVDVIRHDVTTYRFTHTVPPYPGTRPADDSDG